MVSRLTIIDLAPVKLFEWPLLPSVNELHLLSALLFIVATAVVIRFVTREFQPKMQRVLLLGAGPLVAKLTQEIHAATSRRYRIVGIVDDERPDVDAAAGAPWLGPCDQLSEIVERIRPARIIVAAADRRDRLPMQSLLEWRVKGILVEDASEFYERLTGKIAIEALRPSVLIMAKGFRNHGSAESVARVVSMIFAATALVLVAPLLALLALAIKVDSRGPVFFIQERAGRDGRPFGLIKFRTMHPCADVRSEWVVDNMDRITRIGRWLRRFRLDELPQFVNVLRGEMNFVGPRPHPTGNHVVFMERIAYYGLRSSVRPGVTGWAQVRYGYANNLDEETEKMRYDLFYIKNRSLWLDAWIVLETIAICVCGMGASAVRRASPSRSELAPLPLRPARQPVPVRLKPSPTLNPSTTLRVNPSGNSAA
jgi:exopolysaccharide biosynthesis polyprenyl glycosylphosphotransferase